jgi:hypothetical protein
VQPWVPAICRNEHRAPNASCCAATLESPTAAFHSPESFINSRTVGSCSDCAESKCFAAASYPSLRTFQFLCAKRSDSGRELKSSSASAMAREYGGSCVLVVVLVVVVVFKCLAGGCFVCGLSGQRHWRPTSLWSECAGSINVLLRKQFVCARRVIVSFVCQSGVYVLD